MASANPLWGAPRIHGELLKLGIEISERTVSRLMPKKRTGPSQIWKTFLANHIGQIVSIDFFTAPTLQFRVLFVFVVLGLIAGASGFSIVRFLAYIKEELLLVLGTSSSETALPGMLQKMRRLGCAESTVGLVIPTGYSFNPDGTSIYMTMAAIFLAQATNTPLSLGQQITLLAVAMVSSKGASGVTGAGFIALAATLAVVPTLPMASLALLVGIDRFMSEGRAIVNLIGNGVATVVISRSEREVSVETLNANLRQAPGDASG